MPSDLDWFNTPQGGTPLLAAGTPGAVDGPDIITINVGGVQTVFEFDTDGNVGAGNVSIDISSLASTGDTAGAAQIWYDAIQAMSPAMAGVNVYHDANTSWVVFESNSPTVPVSATMDGVNVFLAAPKISNLRVFKDSSRDFLDRRPTTIQLNDTGRNRFKVEKFVSATELWVSDTTNLFAQATSLTTASSATLVSYNLLQKDNGAAFIFFGADSHPSTIDMHQTGYLGADVAILGKRSASSFPGLVRSAEFLGLSAGCVGDFNGDGIDDIIVGSSEATNETGEESGAAYIVFGSSSPSSTVDLAAGATANVRIASNAEQAFDGTSNWTQNFGASVTGGFDFNGDGYDDTLIGSPMAPPPGGGTYYGNAFMVLGSASPPALYDATTSPANMLRYMAPNSPGGQFGLAVGTLGDINNDGYDDCMIGGYNFDGKRKSFTGKYSKVKHYFLRFTETLPTDGQTVTITHGGTTKVFEFDSVGGVAGGNIAVDLTGLPATNKHLTLATLFNTALAGKFGAGVLAVHHVTPQFALESLTTDVISVTVPAALQAKKCRLFEDAGVDLYKTRSGFSANAFAETSPKFDLLPSNNQLRAKYIKSATACFVEDIITTGTPALTDNSESTAGTEEYRLDIPDGGGVFIFTGSALPTGKNLSAGDQADIAIHGTRGAAHVGVRLGAGGAFGCSASSASSRFPWLLGLFAALVGAAFYRARRSRSKA